MTEDTKATERPAKRTRGQPRKDDVVLAAAEKAFLSNGYALTSMEDIARIAKVSKPTIYSNFGNKEQLFSKVIRNRCADVVPDTELLSKASAMSLEMGLEFLGFNFLKNLLSAKQIELYQTVMSAARHQPQIGKIMYEGPIRNSQDMIASYFAEQVRSGKADIEDTDLAATYFIALLKTNVHMKFLFNQQKRASDKELTESVRSCVRYYLHGVLNIDTKER